MKRLLVVSALVVVVIVVIGLAYAQTRPEKLPAVASHYQLVPATVTYEGKDGRQADGPELFLLDTENGHVWKYEFSRALGKPGEDSPVARFPAYFERVSVAGLPGWDLLDEQLRRQQALEELRKNRKQP